MSFFPTTQKKITDRLVEIFNEQRYAAIETATHTGRILLFKAMVTRKAHYQRRQETLLPPHDANQRTIFCTANWIYGREQNERIWIIIAYEMSNRVSDPLDLPVSTSHLSATFPR